MELIPDGYVGSLGRIYKELLLKGNLSVPLVLYSLTELFVVILNVAQCQE
jgi:hypothetical protein